MLDIGDYAILEREWKAAWYRRMTDQLVNYRKEEEITIDDFVQTSSRAIQVCHPSYGNCNCPRCDPMVAPDNGYQIFDVLVGEYLQWRRTMDGSL